VQSAGKATKAGKHARPAADVKLRSQVSSRGRIVVVPHSSSSSTSAIASPGDDPDAQGSRHGHIPRRTEVDARRFETAALGRHGGRSHRGGQAAEAPAALEGRQLVGRVEGDRAPARMPGIEDPAAAIGEPDVVRAGVTADEAVVTRFVQQRRKPGRSRFRRLRRPGQQPGRAEEGVLAPGHGVRPGRGPEAGVPRPCRLRRPLSGTLTRCEGWRDRHLRFHFYDQLEPSPDIGDLLREIDCDPIAIFWG
jgi:hypothetical protein